MAGKVISFINMKGGVGKTTLAVNIAYVLATVFGKKVLLVDVDPQMNASQYTLDVKQVLKILEEPATTICGMFSTLSGLPSVTSPKHEAKEARAEIFPIKDNFDIIPSHLEIMRINLDDKPFRLKQYLREKDLRKNYDVIILDSPPTISAYTRISLLASDGYVVPMCTDYLSFFGLPLLQKYIETLAGEFELKLDFYGIILNMVRPDWNIYYNIKKKLQENPEWRAKLFQNEIKYRTVVSKALSPEEREKQSPYILDLNDPELTAQITDVSTEFMQRGRL